MMWINMRFVLSLFALAICATGCATAPQTTAQTATYRPAVNFAAWRSEIAGPTTKVATLGSQHLAELPDTFDMTTLALLIDKLAVFNPTIITHEDLSGEQCDMISRHEKIYPEIYKDYCTVQMVGVLASGPSLAAARIEAGEMLKTWPASPSAAQRRKLASLFLASGAPPSALVQWHQLPVSQRVVGDGVTNELLEVIGKLEKRRNETFQIAVALAVRLGLQRMYAVDDHTADGIQALAPVGYEAALQTHWTRPSNKAVPEVKQMTLLAAKLTTGEETLNYFRFLNAPSTQRAFVNLDFRDAMALQSPQLFGRQYVAWYETRNLRMVANIRAAFGNSPGARVLNIVGASHKAYYEAYLSQMSEVELVDMEAILK